MNIFSKTAAAAALSTLFSGAAYADEPEYVRPGEPSYNPRVICVPKSFKSFKSFKSSKSAESFGDDLRKRQSDGPGGEPTSQPGGSGGNSSGGGVVGGQAVQGAPTSSLGMAPTS